MHDGCIYVSCALSVFSFAACYGYAGPCRTVQAIVSVPVLQHYRTAGDGHYDQPSQGGRPVVRDLREGESYCSLFTVCRLYAALNLFIFTSGCPVHIAKCVRLLVRLHCSHFGTLLESSVAALHALWLLTRLVVCLYFYTPDRHLVRIVGA